MPALFVPEALGKGFHASLERLTPTWVKPGGDVERVEPQRLNLDRLADSRRDYALANPRVHPRQLHAWHACGEQTIVVHQDAESCSGRVASHDRQDCGLERTAIVARDDGRS